MACGDPMLACVQQLIWGFKRCNELYELFNPFSQTFQLCLCLDHQPPNFSNQIMFNNFFFCCSTRPKLKCENDSQKPLLITKEDDHDELHNPTMAMALLLTSWLNGRRLRYLILALCLPLLIPIVFAIFPFLCAVEICFRFCRRGRKRCRLKSGPPLDAEGGGQVVVVVELNLLERYLDDQLGLALEIACECDDETDDFYSNRSYLLC